MPNVVSIQIVIDDSNAPETVQRISDAIAALGTSGSSSMGQLSGSVDGATDSLSRSSDAAAVTSGNLDRLAASANNVASGYDLITKKAQAAETRAATANGEMQQMLLNMEAAQKKLSGAAPAMHGPQTRDSALASMWGTAALPQYLNQEAETKAIASMTSLLGPAQSEIKKTGDAMKSLGGHTTTSLDQIRLLSQEFGLRLPRAMEAALSRMPGLTAGIAGFASGILAIGAAEVFVHVGEEIYDAEQKFISITSAADKFYETLKKTSELDFTNTRDLTTTQRRLDEATQSANASPVAAKSMQSSGLLSLVQGNIAEGIGEIFGAKTAADAGAVGAQRVLDISRKQIDQQHEQALAQIELNHAMDDTLSKRAQIAAAVTKEQQISNENRGYDRRVQGFYGNPTTSAAGSVEQQTKDAQAQAEAAAKTIQLNQEVSQAIMKARDAATQAGLQGEALYQEKQKDGIRELIAELNAQHLAEEIPARVKALNEQYDNERLARLRELTAETQRMHAETASAGLTGASRILSERDAAVSGINAKQAKFPGGAAISPEAQADFDQQRADAAAAADQKISALEDTFSEHTKQIVAQRTEATLGGYAKIDAAAQMQVAELKKTYDQDFANAKLTDDQKLQAATNYNAAVNAIDAAAADQKKELAAKNHADDLAFEQQAEQAERRVREQGPMGWVASYRDAIAEIETQEQERLAKLQENAAKEGLTDEEVAQRKVAIYREADAQIASQNQQVQHEIAGTLQQAFTNPIDFIKSKMEQMFFEIIAAWIMRLDVFKNLFGSTMGGLQPGGAASGSSGAGMLGNILGIRPPSGTGGVISGGARLPSGGGGGAGSSEANSVPTFSSTPSSNRSSSSATSDISAIGGGVTSLATRSGVTVSQASAGSASGGGSPSSYFSTPSSSAAAGPAKSSDIAGTVGSGISDAKTIATQFGLTGSQASAATAGTESDSSVGGISTTQDGSAAADGASDGADDAMHEDGHSAMSTVGGGPNALSQGLGLATAGMAIYSGGKGMYDSFFQGGVKGAVDGTMSGLETGASVGMLVGGPAGALIGGAVGAVAGLTTNLVGQAMGEAGRTEARDYYRKTIFPQMDGIMKQFEQNGGSYLSAVSDENKAYADGMQYMKTKFGLGTADWVNQNYLQKELTDTTSQIERMAASGSEYIGRTAAEFHTGGRISGFGDFGTSSNEGFIHAMLGEGVVKTSAMAMHGTGVDLMNSGADAATMASHYLRTAGGGASSTGSSTTSHHTWNVQAMDSRSFGDFLDGGGMNQINKSANRRVSLYGGDASV